MRITLADQNGVDTYTVPAYRTVIPQLATHRRLDRHGVPMAGRWDVTHVESGMKITFRTFETRTLAKAFVAELDQLNWAFDYRGRPTGAVAELYARTINSARATLMGAAD
jgi:hypothetical protein